MRSRSLATVAAIAIGGVALTSTGAVASAMITSSQIKDQTILVRDIAPSTVKLLRTPKTYQKRVTHTLMAGQQAGWNTACTSGDLAIGGGAKPDGPGVLNQGSYPYSVTAGNGWVQQLWNTSDETREVVTYTICVDR